MLSCKSGGGTISRAICIIFCLMLCAITDVRVHAIVMRMFLIARPLRFGARGGVVAALPKVRLAMGAGQAKRDLRSRGPVRQIFVCCRLTCTCQGTLQMYSSYLCIVWNKRSAATAATGAACAPATFLARFGRYFVELDPVPTMRVAVKQEVRGTDRLHLFARLWKGRAHAE